MTVCSQHFELYRRIDSHCGIFFININQPFTLTVSAGIDFSRQNLTSVDVRF